MKSSEADTLQQHYTEIHRNREAWHRKPRLRATYHDFYQQVALGIDRRRPGLIVELGSGIGAIKNVVPDCITTDLFANPWLDRRENAYRLTFANGTVSHLILFDVWHHLRFPGTALREFHRVLVPHGRLILFEPAVSWLGRIVYQYFHPEPVGLGEAITWFAPPGFAPEQADYFAAQGSATRLFWWEGVRDRLDGWQVKEVRPIVSFAYLATGGFSGPQVGGACFHAAMRRLDRVTQVFPRALAARLLVVLERR